MKRSESNKYIKLKKKTPEVGTKQSQALCRLQSFKTLEDVLYTFNRRGL